MPDSIRVTWDYLCPFARNAHVTIAQALRDSALSIPVTFHAFSLTQNHTEPGNPPIWDRPAGERGSGVLALEWGIAVRDNVPDAFLDFHVQAFAARHDDAVNINDIDVLRSIATACDLDPSEIEQLVATGEPIATLAAEHVEAVDRWSVFGVPTFIVGEDAVFIRFMERGNVPDLLRAIELLDTPNINEFKHTAIPR
jgi:predicted DsbA family dithiol-disulfide isomerase